MHSPELREPYHPSAAPELIRLRRENEYLREMNRHLLEGSGANPDLDFIRRCRTVFGIEKARAKLLAVLLAGQVRDKAAILNAYSGNKRDIPEIKIVDVLVCRLRRALKPHGATIRTDWGVGYYIAAEDRERIRALLDGADV